MARIGCVWLTVGEVRNIGFADEKGPPDTFVKLSLDGNSVETRTVRKDRNPAFEESFPMYEGQGEGLYFLSQAFVLFCLYASLWWKGAVQHHTYLFFFFCSRVSDVFAGRW